MHLLLRFVLLGFVSYALGNFWVFEQDGYTGEENYPGYRFFNCDEVKNAAWWPVMDDVSDDKQGVRVIGDLTFPDTFEANVGHVHFTIYEHRGYGLFDLNDNQHGTCRIEGGLEYVCGQNDEINGHSTYHCNSDYVASDMQ
ncbi:hypothetical protein PG996_016037 [Apiospora saccharicola]|uniref:Uncharacterized protein n=1 Tax=Apiospora saccharicola TaxID=335842 RepID=A0ABR1TQK1_9PEZI